MRPWLPLSALLLVGCSEFGTLIVQGDVPDPPVFPDQSDSDLPVDPGPPPISADNCGPYVEPTAFERGREISVRSGDTVLRRSGAFSFDWTWSGCEVERFFDRDGLFDCETYWDATGSLQDIAGGGPEFVYRVARVVNTEFTTCEPSEDSVTRYGLEVQWLDGTMNLSEADPGAPPEWLLLSEEAPFESNDLFTRVELHYVSGFID